MGLKKYLKQFNKEQLIEQLLELNKKYPEVKTYYEFTLNPLSDDQADKVKKKIHKLFNPPFGQDPRLREARNEIKSFKKLAPPEEKLADIMLHYVECGVEFTNNYGDINEPFYNSIAGVFHDAGEFIEKNGLQNHFKQRCKKIMDDSSNIGWGFHDELSDHYYVFFEK
jgi:Family of unknown function (DUF6155)